MVNIPPSQPAEADTPAPAEPPDSGYRFGAVLALLLVLFSFLAAGPTGTWVPVVTVALEGAALIGALLASRSSRRLLRLATVVVALSVLGTVSAASVGLGGRWPVGLVLTLLLTLAVPVAIGRALVRRRVVDVKTILGALTVYVSIGLLFAFAFMVVQAIQAGPFFAQNSHGNTEDFVYFSFVTLTTVGYGDLTAITGAGRALAALEGMTGQLYLVTVVALLVSNFRPRISAPEYPSRSLEGSPTSPGGSGAA